MLVSELRQALRDVPDFFHVRVYTEADDKLHEVKVDQAAAEPGEFLLISEED